MSKKIKKEATVILELYYNTQLVKFSIEKKLLEDKIKDVKKRLSKLKGELK